MSFSYDFYEEIRKNRKILHDFLRLVEQNKDEASLLNSQPIMVIPINKNNNQILPLKSLQYTIEIIGSLAYITLKQEYENSNKIEIDLDYFFSFSSDSCFYDFEASIGDLIIKGDIKAKNEAKEQFEINQTNGDLTGFASLCTNIKDIIQLNLCNIPPMQAFSIQFSYLQQMHVSQNKFWMLHIHSLNYLSSI